MRVSYGDQVCVWTTRLPEGLRFAARHPDTDAAYKNMRLYAERLRDLIGTVARVERTAGGASTVPSPRAEDNTRLRSPLR